MRKAEGRLQFDFKTALQVHQEEVKAQPFKCADFIAEETDALWMIEVTDALKADEDQLQKSIAELLGQTTTGKLFKDSLMKLYGTHPHVADKKLLAPGEQTRCWDVTVLRCNFPLFRTTGSVFVGGLFPVFLLFEIGVVCLFRCATS